MTRNLVLLCIFISTVVMLIIHYFFVSKSGFKANFLGMSCFIFTVLPITLAIGGINKLSAGTYGVLIIIFIIGLFLIKPGFKKTKNST